MQDILRTLHSSIITPVLRYFGMSKSGKLPYSCYSWDIVEPKRVSTPWRQEISFVIIEIVFCTIWQVDSSRNLLDVFQMRRLGTPYIKHCNNLSADSLMPK
ncbi:hypothetical protein CEXT_98851 [Caerostris extrusa]|uniref:Uncharacterized protein n=1 Tax=Caerostris extrusa TaxID=172846 RepID=A0AAV4SH14_CAEEX|nr:hypothetical protein CEXT_98851 [Caerostris extrusa]